MSEQASQQLKITTPADWVSVDSMAVAARAASDEDLPPEIRTALTYLSRTAEIFEQTHVLHAAFLVERGNPAALATMATFVVGLPDTDGHVDLMKTVRDNPPADAVEGSVQVRWDDERQQVRVSCLRRSVLEMASNDTVSHAVEYFQRIPESSNMLVTTFATPNVAEADTYTELFDSIAAGIEFV